jgi:hypothetical protein
LFHQNSFGLVICYNGFYGLWGGCESWWKRTCN